MLFRPHIRPSVMVVSGTLSVCLAICLSVCEGRCPCLSGFSDGQAIAYRSITTLKLCIRLQEYYAYAYRNRPYAYPVCRAYVYLAVTVCLPLSIAVLLAVCLKVCSQ